MNIVVGVGGVTEWSGRDTDTESKSPKPGRILCASCVRDVKETVTFET